MRDQRELLQSLDQLYQTAYEDGRQEIAPKWSEALDWLEQALNQNDRMKKALAEIKDIAEDVSISVGAALKKIHDLVDTALGLG